MYSNFAEYLDFFVIVLLIILVIYGISLFFRKKNNKNEYFESYVKKLSISDEAKEIRLKELKKQTGPLFSKEWFLNYWEGRRSLFYAVFTTGMVAQLILFIVIFPILLVFLYHQSNFFENLMVVRNVVYRPLNFLLDIISMVIIWRCSKNSTKGWRFVGRVYVFFIMLSVITTFFNFYNFLK